MDCLVHLKAQQSSPPAHVLEKNLFSLREIIEAKMVMIALFVTTAIWKQSNCPSVGEWVNKLSIHPLEYYENIKINEIELMFQDRKFSILKMKNTNLHQALFPAFISILHLFKFRFSSKILPETFPDVSNCDPSQGACGLYLSHSTNYQFSTTKRPGVIATPTFFFLNLGSFDGMKSITLIFVDYS